MSKYIYLNDSDFLQEIDELPIKEQFVKITILDWNENPIQDIQGKVISGNININGNSTIRRTCNLSMFVEESTLDYQNINQLISINKKVSIEIGFTNITQKYQQYKIIWFPQGIYVIINPSISHTTSGTTIQLSLKDKMCLLNGECGGTFPASVTFSEMDTLDEETGQIITVQPTIYQIIYELVHHFGGEQIGKIIISDVDQRIKQVMKWQSSEPLYIWKEKSYNNGKEEVTYQASLKQPPQNKNAQVYSNGYDIGYIYTDFVYPGQLIGDAGSTVCNILDKIKETLGNYEYFYDLDGNFVFQEIKNYLNTTYATTQLDKINNSDYLVDMSKGMRAYTFDNSKIITSYSNSPQYNNIKNDFIVWGIRETSSGNQIPIRYHLAIDNKPTIGHEYQVVFYDDEDGIRKARAATEADKILAENPQSGQIIPEIKTVKTTDWRSELYLQGVMADVNSTEYNTYYSELDNEWLALYNLENEPNGFKEEVLKMPYEINYFLDFIDSNAAIGQFSVQNIGRRTKVVSDNTINCLFEPTIPDLIFIENNTPITSELREECIEKGQNFIQVSSDIYSKIELGGTFISAWVAIRDLLYQYTQYNESISIQAIPIYHLEPNIRIGVIDNESGINGDFIISSISVPLDVNGSMSISAIKALQKI